MVVVYTSKHCPACREVKKFLKEKEIEFTEKDVEIFENRDEMFKKFRVMTVPITVLNRQVIYGYNREELERASERN